MERILTSKQREDLRLRHRKERDGRIRDRIKAVLAFDEGYTYSEIARILLLDGDHPASCRGLLEGIKAIDQ